jgi:hypothetical protein
MEGVARILVHGLGAVSPAGWGVPALRAALERGQPLPARDLPRPGWDKPLRARTVPPPSPKPAFLGHPRLRRTSPITQFAVGAALEALDGDVARVSSGEIRLGIVLCVMTGCVNYSRRFYDETWRDPATASPLIFPETVFNAPSSHLAAMLGTTAINYTLVGDPGTFVQGLVLAADWLLADRVDSCLVLGAEELDWLTADAFRMFTRNVVLSEGAGAIYLRRVWPGEPTIALGTVTEPRLFFDRASRVVSVQQVRDAMLDLDDGQARPSLCCENAPHPPCGHPLPLRAGEGRGEGAERTIHGDSSRLLLCDSQQGVRRLDAAEVIAWKAWPGTRLSPKKILGEGLMAAAAWQCVAAADALQHGHAEAALVSVAGCNQQAIGARFERLENARPSSA